MGDKAEAFAECLLGDIFACISKAVEMEIKYSREEKERFVPDDFFEKIIAFSRVLVAELMADMSRMPVLLCHNEDFFRRFTNSVCLKLLNNNNDDPEVGFLKAMAFLMLITTTAFVHTCYRPLDLIPTILRKLLKDGIKTKFYEEGRFGDILSLSEKLKEDKNWCESTVEEMRTCMKDSLQTELPATKIVNYDPLQPDRTKIRLMDVREMNLLTKEASADAIFPLCKYCGTACIILLKEFFKPKIRYKSDCLQM